MGKGWEGRIGVPGTRVSQQGGEQETAEDGENGRNLLSKDQEDRRKWRGDPE